MSISKSRAYFYLHTAVFLWGFTAILGKLISYGSVNLVWHRMLLTGAVFLLFPAFWKNIKKLPSKDVLRFAGIGALVMLHWVTFYGSIKLGNSVSITLACLGTSSFFTSIFDPLINKRPFQKIEMILGIIVLLGLVIIYFGKNQENLTDLQLSNTSWAIVSGVVSAGLAALFSTLNKNQMHKTSALVMSGIEMVSGAILLSLVMLVFPQLCTNPFPSFNILQGNYDLVWILILVLFCTNFTFWISIRAMEQMSAFTANLSINLEPVYGIILGAVLFKEYEQLNGSFYIGAIIILLAVVLQPIIQKIKEKKHATY